MTGPHAEDGMSPDDIKRAIAEMERVTPWETPPAGYDAPLPRRVIRDDADGYFDE